MSSFQISHIQSLILQRQAAKQPRKTAVPQEYYEAMAFHESLKLGEFTFDTTFDRVFSLDGKLVYVLGSTQVQYDEEMVDEKDGRMEDFEYVSLWCYDTRDGKYRRFEQRWNTTADVEDELDIHISPVNHMKLYKTPMEFDTFQAMLESEDPKVFGPSIAAWTTYTVETIAHAG